MDNIQAFIKETHLSLVYISQPNCSVCHSLLPQVEEVLKNFPSIKSIHIDAYQVPEVAAEFSVMTVPAVLVFNEGRELFRKARFVPIEELHQELTKFNHFINKA